MADKDMSNRDFCGMDELKQHDIANKGGHDSREKGHAHQLTPREAAEAGGKAASIRRAVRMAVVRKIMKRATSSRDGAQTF